LSGGQVSHQLETWLGCPPLIRLNGKAPLDPKWSSGPRCEPDVWRTRLDGYTGNVGLVTGNGLFVVDVDLYVVGAEDSVDDLYDLGLPAETATVLTGGGGRHLYYRSPVPIVSRALAGYPGIDIKGDGGQVVVPPSVHPETGRSYEWECGYGPDDGCVIATPPAHVLELFAGSDICTKRGELDERDEDAVNLLIERFEAHSPQQREGYVEITRPGKERGVSATVGAVGRGVTKVWSSNWPDLPVGVYDLTELRKLACVPGPTFAVKVTSSADLPAGYRLWQAGDDMVPDPTLGRDAYIGPVGSYLDLLDGRTEAHPAAIGIGVLAALGTIIGRRAQYRAGRIVHHCNLFAAIVGPSSEGAKGVADAEALALITPLVPSFLADHSIGGLGSGEALIRELADGLNPPAEKRRIVFDAELSSVLKVANRPESILGDVLRKAYDYSPLRHSTVTNSWVTASDHHIAIVGAITPEELRSLVGGLAISNGFANRFLFVWSRIVAYLPDGGDVDPVAIGAIADQIDAALKTLDGRLSINGTAQLAFDPAARDRWASFYRERRIGIGEGIGKALSSRHVAHAARLALIYAVLDGAAAISSRHVDAAIAWCDYSRASAEKAFGASLGGQADRLLTVVRDEMPDGIYASTLHDGLAHNWKAGQLTTARALLEERHLLYVISEPSVGGRPRSRYAALSPQEGRK
jgi:hypothetical protein